MSGLDQARSTARFVSDDPVAGVFSVGTSSFNVTVRDVSVNGAQIEHTQPIRPAVQGRLTIGELNAPAVVIWTRMSVPGVYRSGLRLEEELHVVAGAIREMLGRGIIRKDEDTIRRREQARVERERARARLVGDEPEPPLPEETLRTIRKARQWFLTRPDDAVKWYQRARMTATEEMLRIAGSGRLNREDVLAIWESLERRFDLRDVVRALD